MIQNDHFIIKTKVYFNKGSMQMLRCMKGHCALVVSDGIMQELGYLKMAQGYLKDAGINSAVFTGVKPDPDVNVVAAGVEAYESCNADLLVALGGGSVIDTAKAILYFVWERHKARGEKLEKPCFVAIPSTSGTGSEVTNFSVISAKGAKNVLIDEFIAPDVALLDPELTATVPPHITADTGMDVLTHAFEAYVSTAAGDFTDACAEKSIRMVWNYLERAVADGGDMEARERMHNASCLAGVAFNGASLGICHSMAHALGARFHLAHGRSNAILLPHVIAWNAGLEAAGEEAALGRYVEIANMLGISAGTPKATVHGLIRQIRNLMKRIGIPEQITELGVEQEEFLHAVEDMAEKAAADSCTDTNPRRPEKAEFEDIYRRLCKGGTL